MNIELEQIELVQYKVQKSFLFFTRYFFKHRYNRKFVIGEHHRLIADVLEKVLKGEIKLLIINVAPRYGKTELAVKNFIAHGLALNPSAKFIHLSYSDDLALDNSEDVKEIVKSEEYQLLFPNVQVKQGSDSKKKWYTTANGGVYATGAGGQVTGFGAGKVDVEDEELNEFLSDIEVKQGFAGALIIDDPIKPEDADNETAREKVNTRFDSTIRNRVNSRNTPMIIIMQRLHEHDLCGYLMDIEPGKWHVLRLPSIKADGTALWPFKQTLDELLELKQLNPLVFERQHEQDPKPLKGRLYKTFKTYSVLPTTATTRRAVVDTADEGDDYLCSIVYSPLPYGYFINDIIYTQEGMEVTEDAVAEQFAKYTVEKARIESNNGGRSFARNVEKASRMMGNTKTIISWFHQTANKQARIYTQAAEVQNMIYYPDDWEKRWPAFARHVKSYMAQGKNEHDDAEDALTMIVEAEKSNNKGIKVAQTNYDQYQQENPLDWV